MSALADLLDNDKEAKVRYADALAELGYLVLTPSQHLFTAAGGDEVCVLCGCDSQDAGGWCDRGLV